MLSGWIYKLLYVIVRAAMFLYHPVFRVYGRENVPKEGRLLICPNHSGMADPIWIILALRLGHIPRIMAKKELMKVPLLGWLVQKLGAFGVDRGGNDVSAIKTGLRCLKDEQQLLIFPEGSRVRAGKKVEPKRGVMLLAHRTDTPILPVYLTSKRYPFSPLKCVIGEPFKPDYDCDKPTDQQLEDEVHRLMAQIYEMGEKQ